MVIYFGSDHGGFALKQKLMDNLKGQGYEVVDAGNTVYDENDDYPDFAAPVAEKVGLNADQSRGILICRSGAGMDIVANKFKNVRAMLGFSSDQVYDTRRDDDVNILCVPSDFVNEDDAQKLVDMFLSTPFSKGEKYERRIQKIYQIEAGEEDKKRGTIGF